MKASLRSLLFIASISLAPIPAGATTLLRMDLPQLSQSADAVVRGTVQKVQSRWSGDRRRIVTDVEVEVAEVLKGGSLRKVIVTQPGGQVGDIGQRVAGLAAFTSGEEVVLFLQKKGPDRFHVSGMAQGKFRIQRTGPGKPPIAIPEPLGDTLLLDPSTGQATESGLRALPLATLKSTVLKAAAASEGKPPESGR
jgi:hypothetical protein